MCWSTQLGLQTISFLSIAKSSVEDFDQIFSIKGSNGDNGPIATDMLFSGRSQDNIMGLVEACPMGRLGVTMDVAKIVGFLASDNREWVYGQIIGASGGIVVK
ncbi:hypothetical protein AB3S75_022496 [Citrus x aurantiifolia]